MIKYKTSFGLDIERVEIIKENENWIWVHDTFWNKTVRQSKKRSWMKIHNDYTEARQYLIEKAVLEFASAEHQVDEAKKELARAAKIPLKEPKQ